jgi:hypothetical protein
VAKAAEPGSELEVGEVIVVVLNDWLAHPLRRVIDALAIIQDLDVAQQSMPALAPIL